MDKKRKMTGAEVICQALVNEGVPFVFGLPGGAILPIYDAMSKNDDLTPILVRHEQSASMAADGYSRATGKVGVCIATSGPGATNLITGLAGALMDSVPMVAITGQIGRGAIGLDAFQEMDITGVTLATTKHNYLVTDENELGRTIHEAFHIARTGRPGPVLVDIPKDVQEAVIEYDPNERFDLPGYVSDYSEPKEEDIKKAADLIFESEKPVILAGHGVISSGGYRELYELATKTQIPVITSLLGISAFDESHPLSFGFPGMHGMAYSSIALNEADLIIGLGARFDDRIVGDTNRFATGAKKIHVDIDAIEIGKTLRIDLGINADVRAVMKKICEKVKQRSYSGWIKHLETLKKEHPLRIPKSTKPDELHGQEVVKTLSKVADLDAIICTGVGQHQMWAAQWYEFTSPNTLITSGGLGAMGFEVPTAIGAQLGFPKRQVWSICGDGGFQMTMMELATVVEKALPIKYLLMNNNHLGLITQWQDMFYDKSYCCDSYTGNPDFVKLADAYGIKSIRISSKDELEDGLKQAAAYDGPVLVDAVIQKVEHVYPMIPAGKSIQELMEEPS